MTKRAKAKWKAYRRKLRLVAVTPSLRATWTAPAVRELSGVRGDHTERVDHASRKQASAAGLQPPTTVPARAPR
jgi:hypothetical protein